MQESELAGEGHIEVSQPGSEVNTQNWRWYCSNRNTVLFSNLPNIKVFSSESTFHIMMSAKYWSFSFSISPFNEYSGLISFRIDWISLQSKVLSSVFSSTMVRRQWFFSIQHGSSPWTHCLCIRYAGTPAHISFCHPARFPLSAFFRHYTVVSQWPKQFALWLS